MIRVSDEVGPSIGNCDQKHKAWYFNAETGMCEEFTYSGCGGNRNRFSSSDECYRYCGISKFGVMVCCL